MNTLRADTLLLAALILLTLVATSVADPVDSKVINVTSSRFEKKAGKAPASSPVEFGFGDQLVFKVENLQALHDAAKAAGKPIIPYILHLPLAGLDPLPYDPAAGELRYILSYDLVSKETWTSILGGGIKLRRTLPPADVSVGVEGGYPLPVVEQDRRPLQFVVLNSLNALFAAIVALGVVVMLVLLSRKSNLIRDTGPNPPDGKKPYSLARFQMACFFALTILAFLFLWALTGSAPEIPQSVLVLLGISASTGLAVIVQDKGKPTQTTKLEARLSELTSKSPLTQDEQTEKQNIEAQIAAKGAAIPKNVDFITDVLTDSEGISFHRFQMFAWTLVLALVFVFSVYDNLSMPTFDATLLSLLGISSGTYLGFMIPEQHSSEQYKPNT